MRIRDYFKQSVLLFGRSVAMFFKGVIYGTRRLFTAYPNPTWAVIAACIVVLSIVKVGEARTERDSYSRKTALLQHQLDSCLHKEIRYTNK